MTHITNYLDNINKRYRLGNVTEHTFRGDLQHLIEALVPDIRATNEPKRISCGAPDYVLTRKEIPVGFIEAKDIGDKDLARYATQRVGSTSTKRNILTASLKWHGTSTSAVINPLKNGSKTDVKERWGLRIFCIIKKLSWH